MHLFLIQRKKYHQFKKNIKKLNSFNTDNMISEGTCDTGVKADGNKYILKYIKIGNIIEIAIIHFFQYFWYLDEHEKLH